MNLDWALFQALNGLANRWTIFDRAIQFLMNDYALTTILSALLVVLWFRGRRPEERRADHAVVVETVIALLLASAVVKLFNLTFFRLRPFTAHEGVRVLFYYPSDSSLPSNSATVAFALAVGAALCSRELGALGIAVAIVFGLSRVIGGVHYPTDILAGALLATGTVWLVHRANRWLAPVARGVDWLGSHLFLA